MGNILSKRSSYDIETYEGWDKKMQEILDNLDMTNENRKNNLQRYKTTWNMNAIMYTFGITLIVSLFYWFSISNSLIIWSLIATVAIIIFLHCYRYYLRYRMARIELVLSSLVAQKNEHLNLLTRVKACIPDITQLMVKYNIDSRYFNTSEVESRNKVIKQLLSIIQQLVELPICKDCRYYTKEGRSTIMSSIPPAYRSLFDKVEPKQAELISKPMDEKLMLLLGEKEEEGLIVKNVMLLDNETTPDTQEKDDVIIEEIMEEEEPNDDVLNEGLKHRNVANVDSHVSL